ncbi:MAG: hypothetical protein KJ592_01075 [Nanoarchaeota archaeon]|nr:hypothetical protein [Nanoarchaeota archaeon]
MDLIKKGKEIILSSQLKNGGILATPNGTYPYIYPRDAVIMTKALNRLDLTGNSKKFYYFLKNFCKIEQYHEVFHRYNINGLPCVTRKNQNDNEGLVLHGIYDTYFYSKDKIFLEEMWFFVNQIVNLIFKYSKTGLVKTSQSIHEFYRLENGYDIWANSACCRGLYDAAKIAKILKHEEEYKKWQKKAEELHKNINKKLFDKKLQVYMKNTRLKKVPDISQIAPFYFELENSNKKLKKTLKYLKENLWHKEIGGFRRFRQFELVVDWHWYTGGSGSWCAFTSFMARLYKKTEDKKNYNECLKWLNSTAKRTKGLFPEHVSTRDEYNDWKNHEIEFNTRLINGSKESEKLAKTFSKKDKKKYIYWATPLGWSHAEYILLKKQP